MLDFYLERPYVAKPNLTFARGVSIALIVTCVFKLLLTTMVGYPEYNFWGIHTSHIPLFIVDNLFCIFFAIYLSHFGMKLPSVMLYVKVGISVATMITSPVMHMYNDNLVYSSVSHSSSVLYIIVYIIVAVCLIRYSKDYIGGMKAVGYCYLLIAVTVLLALMYSIAFSIVLQSSEFEMNESFSLIVAISGITNVLSVVSTVALGACTYSCYNKANRHNKWMISDEAV